MTTASPTLSLRIDVLTSHGMGRGVPALIELLGKIGAKATFCLPFAKVPSERLSLWSDHPLRQRCPYPFWLRCLGAIGSFVATEQAVERILTAGHDVGVLCTAVKTWHALPRLGDTPSTTDYVTNTLNRARALLGERPLLVAAAGLRVERLLLRLFQQQGLTAVSVSQGQALHQPIHDGEPLPLINAPISLPPLLADGADNWLSNHLAAIKASRYHAYLAHAESEGCLALPAWQRTLTALVEQGVSLVSLSKTVTGIEAATLPYLPLEAMPCAETLLPQLVTRPPWSACLDELSLVTRS